jgi:hypothetical protein
MAGTYYKYAERNADSQVNWAEVGKGLSDMLAETNRVREEKKDALDAAQRETMNFIAQTPNGEHVGARVSILDLSDQLSNRMRIADQLLKSGQMSPKDYMVFRQNVTDNTNLAFNANKAYQENYKDVMDGVRDKKYSQITADNYAEVEGFGDWKNIGWEISPDGIIMAGKMTEQEIDGKKVRALDKTAGGVRSMDYLNQAILAKVGFYDYESKVNSWVDKLGKEKQTIITLGKIQKQGKIISRDDITSRKDIDPTTKQVMFEFVDAENAKIDEIAGDELDSARILVDSAIIAPNNKQYITTSDEKLAKTGDNYILKKVDPNTGGFKFELTEAQKKDAKEFVRTQMRAKYNYEEEGQVVGAVQRDEESEASKAAKAGKKQAESALGTWGDVFKATNPEAKKRALTTVLSTQVAKDKGIIDVDISVPGKIIFKNIDPRLNIEKDFDINTGTLGEWNAIGNEIHGIDDVGEVMRRNKGGDPNMRANAAQKIFKGVRAGYIPVKDPENAFSEKVSSIPIGIYKYRDYNAAPEIAKALKGTGITVEPANLLNPSNIVTVKYGTETYDIPVNNNDAEAEQEKINFESWITKVVPAEAKKLLLDQGIIGASKKSTKVQQRISDY